jgi:hypothetical protein
MFYDGYPDKGRCAAGGGHLAQGFNCSAARSLVELRFVFFLCVRNRLSKSTISLPDAQRHDGKRLVARADEKLTAFLDPESAIPTGGKSRLTCWRDSSKTRGH